MHYVPKILEARIFPMEQWNCMVSKCTVKGQNYNSMLAHWKDVLDNRSSNTKSKLAKDHNKAFHGNACPQTVTLSDQQLWNTLVTEKELVQRHQ
jgi:hypothetical protein